LDAYAKKTNKMKRGTLTDEQLIKAASKNTKDQIERIIEGMKKVFNPNKIIPSDVHTHGLGYNEAVEEILEGIKDVV